MGTDRSPELLDEARPTELEGDDEGGSTTAPPGALSAIAAAALLSACGGGSDAAGGSAAVASAAGETTSRKQILAAPSDTPAAVSASVATTTFTDAARFLAQASFGPKSIDQITALQAQGFDAWLSAQFALPAYDHSAYIESQRGRDNAPGETRTVSEEMSYEAVWQHWLRGEDQLRARMVWALLQIMVISNIAPDIRPVAMSSYMDMLGRNAFGNFRQLLQDVTLHPAMGYYLNMLESEKEDPVKGTHPNENYAREVLQLFSIGLTRLNLDGTPQLDASGKPYATYGEDEVKGFAKAFSGWSFGGLDNTKARTFHGHNENDERLWRVPMIAWKMWHSTGTKLLLRGVTLPAGQTPEKDLSDALDNIFLHDNVGPFIGRQLIQRLVTSNPTPGYIARVASVFNNNGAGVRGDLKAVLRAILLDIEARSGQPVSNTNQGSATGRFGKQREPVIRFANFLRGLGATSRNGRNDIHYLDSADDALGQSPLLAPSVFNFYSPNFRPAGPVAALGLVAPEFQITSETSVVGSLNFFSSFFESSGYGSGNSRMRISYSALANVARNTDGLIDTLDQLFFCGQMSASTRTRMRTLVNALPAKDRTRRVKSALLLSSMSPDFVILK
jgi:uncharacterized protein (DUF1800 family)